MISPCAVCDQPSTGDMTDGRNSYPLCDQCRETIRVFFHIFGGMAAAVAEARRAIRSVLN